VPPRTQRQALLHGLHISLSTCTPASSSHIEELASFYYLNKNNLYNFT